MRAILTAVLVIVCAGLALAQGVPVTGPAIPLPGPTPWWQLLLANDSAWEIAGQIVVFLLAWLPFKGWLNGKVGTAVQTGVNEVYRQVIKPIRDQAVKAGQEPPKIDSQTAAQYNVMAIEAAKKSGGILVRILFTMLGPEVLRLLIERAVGKNKELHASPV